MSRPVRESEPALGKVPDGIDASMSTRPRPGRFGEDTAEARYALNSAVLTAQREYRCRLLSQDKAPAWWLSGLVEAPRGYSETCEAVGRVLGVPSPKVDRRVIRTLP